jgi:nucleotide-binding universal stress UspA family protein
MSDMAEMMMPARAPALAPVMVAVARGGSDAAVRFGAEEAHRTGRPLELVHVAPAGDGWNRMLGRDSLHVAIERAHAVAGVTVPVHTELRRGRVLPELVEAAQASAILVLEHRGSGVRRRLDASTSAAVADITDVATVVVPDDWRESRWGVVTVGLDPLATDDLALRSAMVLARIRRAALRVVVVDTAGSSSEVAPLLVGYVKTRLERLGSDACDVEVELASDSAEQVLLERAATSDLLVLGRHRPLLESGSRLGLVARAVLRHAPCPLLLTPPEHIHVAMAQTPSADDPRDEGPPQPRTGVSDVAIDCGRRS